MVKLAGMASALGFTYLFCRRLGTDRVPAVLGAVVYTGSGFIIMWNNWPQADVASLIPALFWATERFLQKRTASSAVPIALALAVLLLAMFPAVVGYTVTVLAGYVAFRLGAALWTARRRPPEPLVAAPAAAAISASSTVSGAGPVPAVAEPAEEPGSVGPGRARVGRGGRSGRPELEADAGRRHRRRRRAGSRGSARRRRAVALRRPPVVERPRPRADARLQPQRRDPRHRGSARGVRPLVRRGQLQRPVAQPDRVDLLRRRRRPAAGRGGRRPPRVRRAPPGTTVGLAVTTVFMGIATFGGGPVLELLQRFPVYDTNFIGRARSILGLTIAALAALGLQALIERGKVERVRSLRPLDVVRLVVVAAAAGWFTVWAYRTGQEFAEGHDRANAFADSMPPAQVIGLVALVVIAVLLVGRGPGRHLLATGLVVLATVQGLILAVPLLPNESRDTLYPETASLVFLREHQGSDRVVPEKYTLFANATMLQGIRSITGTASTPRRGRTCSTWRRPAPSRRARRWPSCRATRSTSPRRSTTGWAPGGSPACPTATRSAPGRPSRSTGPTAARWPTPGSSPRTRT